VDRGRRVRADGAPMAPAGGGQERAVLSVLAGYVQA